VLAGFQAGFALLWMGLLSAYDIRERRLPNALTLPGAAVILLAGGLPALAGAAGLTAIYLVVHLAAPTAMGAGDVKLAISLGGLAGCFGVDVWFLAALAAPLLTALLAMLSGVRAIPHGPSMCLATAAATGLVLLGRAA
jgi:leader peptidase (prepilin peptidase) / N-methyltransferase